MRGERRPRLEKTKNALADRRPRFLSSSAGASINVSLRVKFQNIIIIIINRKNRRPTTKSIEDEASGDSKTEKKNDDCWYSPHADARVRGTQIDPDGWSFRFRGHYCLYVCVSFFFFSKCCVKVPMKNIWSSFFSLLRKRFFFVSFFFGGKEKKTMFHQTLNN